MGSIDVNHTDVDEQRIVSTSYIGYTRVYSPMILNNVETPPSLTYTNKKKQRVTIKETDLPANANSIVNHSACVHFNVEPRYMSQKLH